MAQRSNTQQRRRRHRSVRKRVAGTPARPRLNVFRSLKHTYAQVIDDATGRVLASASTTQAALRGEGSTGTVAAATRVGAAIAERAKAAGVEHVVFDRGGWKYHGRVKALADAARAAGLQF